jgi:DTW domain-containing protein YfiP
MAIWHESCQPLLLSEDDSRPEKSEETRGCVGDWMNDVLLIAVGDAIWCWKMVRTSAILKVRPNIAIVEKNLQGYMLRNSPHSQKGE